MLLRFTPFWIKAETEKGSHLTRVMEEFQSQNKSPGTAVPWSLGPSVLALLDRLRSPDSPSVSSTTRAPKPVFYLEHMDVWSQAELKRRKV